MKTSVIEVGNLLSTLSALGVEKQLMKLPGVHKAEVNYVAGSATVVYDETVTNIKTIKARVHECGYHCAGERLPKHICVPEDPPAAAAASAPAAPTGLAADPPTGPTSASTPRGRSGRWSRPPTRSGWSRRRWRSSSRTCATCGTCARPACSRRTTC